MGSTPKLTDAATAEALAVCAVTNPLPNVALQVIELEEVVGK